ncbi:hypothetical protein [Maricaulis sp.]|uniref:hypothetical protein n=1 Tax=Maricaulis sp. TaxID=1486257 RepID=UPI002605866A|nr:hypothetical protein [Maricaulis sp.]
MAQPTYTAPQPCRTPPRHKQVILTFAGLLGPVYFIPPALTSAFPDQHFLAVTSTVAVIVPLMIYAVMPGLSRIFRGWLWR